MAMAPAAVILAGATADHLLGSIRDLKRTALLLAAVCALFVLSLPPFLPLGKAELDRGDTQFWANLGVAYEKGAQPGKALKAYEEAIRLNPEG